MARAKSQFDQGAGIGNDFALPALSGLEAAHCCCGSVVPNAIGLTVEVVLADQGFLDLARSVSRDLLLAVALPRALVKMAEARAAM